MKKKILLNRTAVIAILLLLSFGASAQRWSKRRYEMHVGAGLTNFMGDICAPKNDGFPGWVGYFGEPMELVIKMLSVKPYSQTLSLSFSHNPSQWVFLPEKVLVSYSKDGIKYSEPEEVALPIDPALKENSKAKVYIIRHKVANKNVKYIKIEAQPVSKLPEWHSNPGEKTWIMMDEVSVE